MEMLRRKKRGKREGSEGSEGCKNNARGRKTSTLKRVSSLADVKLGRSTMNLQREASCRPTTTTATEMRFKYPLVLADIRLACSPRELVVSLRALFFLTRLPRGVPSRSIYHLPRRCPLSFFYCKFPLFYSGLTKV